MPDGELNWQRLQGQVYGALMHEATMADGVANFLRNARRSGATLFVVSHKTEYGHFDPARVNLHDAARQWLMDQGFFADDVHGMCLQNVYFETDRMSKVARIAALDLDIFIDDLPEVFAEPDFPARTRRILFANSSISGDGLYERCADWTEIDHAVFGNR